MRDAELVGSRLGGTTPAATEECKLQTRLLKKAQAESVTHIEAFLQLARGIKPEATAGKDPIHIKNQQLEGGENGALPLPLPFAQ